MGDDNHLPGDVGFDEFFAPHLPAGLLIGPEMLIAGGEVEVDRGFAGVRAGVVAVVDDGFGKAAEYRFDDVKELGAGWQGRDFDLGRFLFIMVSKTRQLGWRIHRYWKLRKKAPVARNVLDK